MFLSIYEGVRLIQKLVAIEMDPIHKLLRQKIAALHLSLTMWLKTIKFGHYSYRNRFI